MRSIAVSFISAVFLFCVAGNSQQVLPRDVADFYKKVIFTINTKHNALLRQHSFSSRHYDLNEKDIRRSVLEHAGKNKLGVMEVEALVMLAMINNAENDAGGIRGLMAELERMNETKQYLHSALQAIEKYKNSMSRQKVDSFKRLINPNYSEPFTVTVKVKGPAVTKVNAPANQKVSITEIQQLQSDIEEFLEDINARSELQTVQLQKETEKRTKVLEAISNIMKKIKDTQDSIIQNLK